jgi:hypothetical protein
MVLCGAAYAQPLTGLPQATIPLSGNELCYLVQGGVSKQVLCSSAFPTILAWTSAATVTAAGTNQGNATALTAQVNVVTTVSAGTGVRLPCTTGVWQPLFNRGANTVLVYPCSGRQIESNGVNVAVGIAANWQQTFYCPTASQCYVY